MSNYSKSLSRIYLSFFSFSPCFWKVQLPSFVLTQLLIKGFLLHISTVTIWVKIGVIFKQIKFKFFFTLTQRAKIPVTFHHLTWEGNLLQWNFRQSFSIENLVTSKRPLKAFCTLQFSILYFDKFLIICFLSKLKSQFKLICQLKFDESMKKNLVT